jgi:hypothetical protein
LVAAVEVLILTGTVNLEAVVVVGATVLLVRGACRRLRVATVELLGMASRGGIPYPQGATSTSAQVEVELEGKGLTVPMDSRARGARGTFLCLQRGTRAIVLEGTAAVVAADLTHQRQAVVGLLALGVVVLEA